MTITFSPVSVCGGRKFKGDAYDLGEVSTYNVAFGVSCESAKLWDPVAMKVVYANPKFMIPREVPEDEALAARDAYVNKVFADTIAYCQAKAVIKSDSEIAKFARNCMLRRYPAWRDEIDKRLPDQRLAYDEIEKTLAWAMGLKTQPCVIYGKRCPGGKDLPMKKKMSIAMASLKNKHIDALDGFKDSWQLAMTLNGTPEYISLAN